jgi:CheY-like chemotaxis protein
MGGAITSTPTGDALGRRKVLVVDDDSDVRSCLLEFLSRAGIAAGGALDGQDALEQIQSGPPPCLIVLDLEMPRLTGPELIAALRADSRCASIPLVSMTAGPSPVDLPTCAHFAKPFEFARLLEVVFSECRRCALCDGEGPVVGSIFDARSRVDRSLR